MNTIKKLLLLSLLCVFHYVSNAQYCIPQNNNYLITGINNFQLNTLVNYQSGSSENGFELYPVEEFTTYLTLGHAYTLQISSSSSSCGKFSVWIDLNDDYEFSESERLFNFDEFMGPGYVSDLLIIPSDPSFIGLKRLRVMTGGEPLFPCYWTVSPGEAEDYYVYITDSIVPNSYCLPLFDHLGAVQIDHFKLNDLHNCASGYPETGYTFYPDSVYTTTLELGKKYPFFISKGSSSGLSASFAMFIDYNDNLKFDPTERIYQIMGVKECTGIYQVPNDTAKLGLHRLRVMTVWQPDPVLPCRLYNSGEAEDYMIRIIQAIPDTDTIVQPPVNRWEIVYSLPDIQWGQIIKETYDQGFLITGVTGNQFTPYQLKISIDGDTLWSKDYPSSLPTYPNGMDTTSDGGFIVCGYQSGGSFLMKADACGDPEWFSIYGQSFEYCDMKDVYQLKDGNFIVSTRYFSDVVTNYDNRFGLAKIDTAGNILWSHNYSKYYAEEIEEFLLTSDNGFLIHSYGYLPFPGEPDLYLKSILTKIDHKGQVEWESVYDTVNNVRCYTNSSEEVAGKGYLSLGAVWDSVSDSFILSSFFTDYNGITKWTKPIVQDEYYRFQAVDIAKINENLYAILADRFDACDRTDFRVALFTIDSAGNVLHSEVFGNISSKPGSLCMTSNGKIMAVSTRSPYNQYCSIYAMKLNTDLTLDTIYGMNLVYDSICTFISTVKYPETVYSNRNVLLYPNPCDRFTTLKIDNYHGENYDVILYSITGTIEKKYLNCKTDNLIIDLKGTKPGLYFAKVLFNNHEFYNKKIIVLKGD